MKFDLNNMGVVVSHRHQQLRPAGNVRLFSRAITDRRRQADGADSRSFLKSQFGNRFDSVNTRLRAGDRVYKQPGRLFRNTTVKSITELFMSFTTSQYMQHLRVFLNQAPSRQGILTKEFAKIERVILSQSRSGSLSQSRSESLSQSRSESLSQSRSGSLSRSNDRRELPHTSRSSVLMSLLNYQPRSRTTPWQTVTLNRRDLLSQLAQTVQATMLHFERPTLARLFAPARTHLAAEKSSRTQLNVGYLTTVQKKIAGSLRQTLVQAIRSPISVQRFFEAKWRPRGEQLGRGGRQTWIQDVQLRRPDRQARSQDVQLIRQAGIRVAQSSGPERQARIRDTQLSRPDTHAPATRAEREFHLITPGWRIVTERSLMKVIGRHGESSQPIDTSRQPGSAMIFSSFARGTDSRRIEKTVPRLSSPGTILTRQSTLETLMNQSGSIGRSLRETSFFKTSRLKQFFSRFRSIETEQSRRATSARTLARKESGVSVPSNGFVFAQPLRQEPPAEQVVKRVEAREVVEIVKKEVNQSLASVASLRTFTRQDYEEISDQVYSSLVRRLTIERERLGFG